MGQNYEWKFVDNTEDVYDDMYLEDNYYTDEADHEFNLYYFDEEIEY